MIHALAVSALYFGGALLVVTALGWLFDQYAARQDRKVRRAARYFGRGL